MARMRRGSAALAAVAAHRSVIEFVLESAPARAEEILPDRQRFGLSTETVARARYFRTRAEMNRGLRIEKLHRTHATENFDCGAEPLNRFLTRYALQNQQAGASQTCVALSGTEVIGVYTLVVGQVEHVDATERIRKGLAT